MNGRTVGYADGVTRFGLSRRPPTADRRRIALALSILVGLSSEGCRRKAATTNEPEAGAFDGDPSLPPLRERPPAKDLSGGTAWLNVDRPLSSSDLEGHVVVVDFWTSACINCMHTLPVLAGLEQAYGAEGLLVIGVHSPKFDAEAEQERLRATIAEFGIRHPIVVDGNMEIWTRWNARAWPTLVVLDARGRVVKRISGEPDKEVLASVVRAALAEAARAGHLDKAPLAALSRGADADRGGPLAFPGKVMTLDRKTVAVTDSGHHRIVLFDDEFVVKDVIGSGLAGFVDGSYGTASFRKPQGLSRIGDVLYVADTENHAVRAVDLAHRSVRTVVGRGELADRILIAKSAGAKVALRSPWDLAAAHDLLYVALAGSHQIAVFDPKDGTIAPFAGDGAELRKDGVGEVASFAQPSGLTTDGTTLWVADSESSSIRAIDLASREVKTVVGKDLFVFGDVDGAAENVRLAHPLGVFFGALGGDRARPALYVTDTLNSKVKRIEPRTGSTRTVAGGKDRRDLFEPSGMTRVGNDLVVADTKHHRLVRIVLSADGDGVTTAIEPRGLTAPASDGSAPVSAPAEKAALSELRVRSGASPVLVEWQAPAGTAVNEEAPFRAVWRDQRGLVAVPSNVKATGSAVKDGFRMTVTPEPGAKSARLSGEVDLVLCDSATHKVCVPVRRAVELSIVVSEDAPREPHLAFPLPAARVD